MAGALNNLKVLDLSRFIAGPLCGMLLGDMGADVIKIERSGKGEEARAIAPEAGGESLYAMMYNRNKRGMTLDYRHADAPALLRKLIAQADVLIENFRPGTMEKMGLGWEEIHALNPRLVMARISGFGQDGPYAQRPCFDVIAQAMSGLMQMTGASDGPPLPAGTFIVDQVTGLYATIGILGALQARERTGKGQMIDAALLDSASTLLLTALPEWMLLGQESVRHGARDRYSAPANNYLCADGRWVHFNGGNAAMFARLATAMNMPELLDDGRFSTHAARMQHAAGIDEIVAAWMSDRDADSAVEILSRHEVPCAKVATISEVADNPQLRHREQIIEIDHPTIGKLPMHGVTVKLSDTANSIRHAPPSVGQHTADVLFDWLGLDAAQVESLRQRRVI